MCRHTSGISQRGLQSGCGVQPSQKAIDCWVPNCSSQLGTAVVQNSLCISRPNHIPSYTTCNLPLTKCLQKAECNIIVPLDEGGIHMCNSKGRLPKACKNLPDCSVVVVHFLVTRQSNPQQGTPPCLPQQCVVGHIGGHTHGKHIHVLGQRTTSRGPNGNWPNHKSPKCGQNGNMRLAFLGVRGTQHGNQDQKCLLNP